MFLARNLEHLVSDTCYFRYLQIYLLDESKNLINLRISVGEKIRHQGFA